jgi:hypothetical protein
MAYRLPETFAKILFYFLLQLTTRAKTGNPLPPGPSSFQEGDGCDLNFPGVASKFSLPCPFSS